ncbi:hypothetical protein ACIBP6_29595 [Nonomuraea terrae]|uniref:hypothetical protein n=1 Tax=Nonomuraea terrae TaxID=2530383 RepID=UPI0037A26E60
MLTRRQFGLGALAAGALALAPATRALADGYDYTSRETFDHFDRTWYAGTGGEQAAGTNEHGGLAWGQSYALAGFVRMYETYKDTHYLDRVIETVDQMLANRDSERGVTDYKGRSLPAWRAMHPYTLGKVTLNDADGRPALEVRSAVSYADLTTVTVRSGTSEGRFTLEVRGRTGTTSTFADLTMDPASPDFAPDRILAAYPSSMLVTAKALGAGVPAAGSTPLVSQPVVFTVHTGMITWGMASFARVVFGTPTLRSVPKYRAKAEEYLQAVRDAAAAHDDEWRQTDDGYGYFVWNKGTPLAYDGTEQPTNQFLALGQTYAEIYAATGDRFYGDRVRALARTFARELKPSPNDAYTWSYWPTFGHTYRGFTKSQEISEFTPSGNGARQIEDLSHGAIDVEFAVLAFRNQLGFNGADMVRLARAYTRNMATTDPQGVPTTTLRVDGTGGFAAAGQYLQAPRWMALAPWDEALHPHALSVYVGRDLQVDQGSHLLGVAYLNWGARR